MGLELFDGKEGWGDMHSGRASERTSRWASNCSMVRKDGEIRVVQDFRGLKVLLIENPKAEV